MSFFLNLLGHLSRIDRKFWVSSARNRNSYINLVILEKQYQSTREIVEAIKSTSVMLQQNDCFSP
jgi:hypothetical protein